MNRTTTGLMCALALALVLPATATAATAPFKGSRTFSVSVQGQQTESSSSSFATDCYDPASDQVTSASGTETYSAKRTFRTRKAAAWEVFSDRNLFGRPGSHVVWRSENSRRELLASGTETRTKTTFNCPAGRQEPAPVCGSRPFSGTVLGLAATASRKSVSNGVHLEFLFNRHPPEFDETCGSGFRGCPSSAAGGAAERVGIAPVSYRRLGRLKRGGKIVLEGKDRRATSCRNGGHDTKSERSLTFTIALRRVR